MALASANELMLRSEASDEVARRAQQIISRQVTQMSRLLEDTLDAWRMRHDKIEVQRKRIDVRAVIEAALDATKPRAAAETINLEVDMPSEPVYAKADATRLQQVVVNVMQNAINHSAAGQAVTVSLSVERQGAVVRVSDEGVGISPDALPKVFEPFFQASHRSAKGMGLGLSVARAIVRAHGGEIHAFSDGLGKGARFEIRLPCIEEATGTPSELPALTARRAGEQAPIPLIDDDEASRESVCALLRNSGYEVHEAGNGNEGLRLIDEIVPSVVILDVGLPDVSGLEIARTVRGKYGSKQTD